MRFVYIITRMDEYGGPQIHVRDFATQLLQYNHEVEVICGSEGEITDYLTHIGVPCHIVPEMTRSIGFLREPVAVWRVYRLLKKIRPDLVSCHSSKAGVVGRLAAKMAGIPVLFTVHGWAFTENAHGMARRVYRWVEKLMGWFSDYIITVSDYDRALGVQAKVIDPACLITVHNGMPDWPIQRPARRAEEAACRIIMVARFAPQKDHATLIEALAQLQDLDWSLSLAGNGDSTEILSQVQRLGLAARVRILGQRADIGDLLNQHDVFALITHWEGFPRSIIEAMRAGLPVVATDVAGVSESVVSGQTGFLVSRQNVAEVADALRRLIRDPGLCQTMGQAARLRYEQNFTFQIMFNHTTVLYEKLTGLPVVPSFVGKVVKNTQVA